MTIQDLYQRQSIPFSLQQHMLTAAAIGRYLTDSWQGPAIDSQAVLLTLLVHDLGNLVKFDLSENAKIIDPELHTDGWREKQREMREKYGSNSHTATQQMLQELHFPEKIIQLANKMDASDVCKITEDSLEQQICEYADLRVVPSGVASLTERLQDLRHRYSRFPGWDNEESYQRNVRCAQRIENTLQQYTSDDITDIPPEKIQAYLVELTQFRLP